MQIPNYGQRGDVSINMTPMIDVVFLLIIFFLVSSHLAKQEANVKLDLPVAKTGIDNNLDRPQLTLNILEDGSWMVAGQWTSRDRFREIARQRLTAENGILRVKIRIARSQPYAKLAEALKLLNEEKIGDIVFGVYESRGGT
ncbi:MAG: biopolymer transporter ExbD [Planctomycetaceae bacterium]|nr:biopolymer transporter ExbD [Planctomycetaceae bacterium]MBN8601365.1 biopolymer transporter ExbD [Planctomycetota bacterium]